MSKGYRSVFGQTPQRLAVAVLALFSGMMFAKPALAADITVGSPVNGTSDTSPIWIRAHNIGCDGLAPTAFGYSLDNSSALNRGTTSYDVDVIRHDIGAGTHTIHFKSWTTKGACPMVSSTFKVVAGTGSTSASSDASTASTAAAATSSIPSSAIITASLDSKPWTGEKDSGTPGSAHGSTRCIRPRFRTMTMLASFTRAICSRGLALALFLRQEHDRNPLRLRHLCLPGRSVTGRKPQVPDMNQVMSNGKTVIFGAQCTSDSGPGSTRSARAALTGIALMSPATRRTGLPRRGTTSRLRRIAIAAGM